MLPQVALPRLRCLHVSGLTLSSVAALRLPAGLEELNLEFAGLESWREVCRRSRQTLTQRRSKRSESLEFSA